MSTPNLCFGAKIRKIDLPLHTLVLLYKSGVLTLRGYSLHGHVFLTCLFIYKRKIDGPSGFQSCHKTA